MKEKYYLTQFTTTLDGINTPEHLFFIAAHNPFRQVSKNHENNTRLL